MIKLTNALSEEDDSDDSNSVEEDSGQSFIEASNSAGIVKELLMNLPLREESIASDPLDALRVSSSDWRSDSTHQSILLLDTTYAHTLNQVLFHSSSELTHANVLTCICPSIDNKDKSVAGAMKKIKDLHLLGPLSLKDGNNYMVIEYTSTNISVSCEEEPKVCWGLSSIEFFSL